MIRTIACVLGFAMIGCVAQGQPEPELGEQSSNIDMGFRLIQRIICRAGFGGVDQFNVLEPDWMIVSGEETVASGTGLPSGEVLAEYGLGQRVACAAEALGTEGEVAAGAGVGGNILWFGLAGVAVAEGAYAGYLCYQLADATCDYNAAQTQAAILDSQISQPPAGCSVQCGAGTFCSPTSGSTCWTQSGLGEGCGWSVGGKETALSGACAAGQCLANNAGGFSCQ
jgi:hypothetical protein